MSTHYIAWGDMTGLIPADLLAQATTDGDSLTEEQIFEAARDSAEEAINGLLSAHYTTPIVDGCNISLLKSVTKYQTLLNLFMRRGYAIEGFPHKATLDPLWKRLVQVSEKEIELDPAKGTSQQQTKQTGAIISGPMRTKDLRGGKLLA